MAIDYWLGGSLDPFFFHVSTRLEVQPVLMFLLFCRIADWARLSAEKCGASKELMPTDPILCALDPLRDGEISAAGIRGAERALLSLDKNSDGQLEPFGDRPPEVTGAARYRGGLNPDASSFGHSRAGSSRHSPINPSSQRGG